MKGEPRQLEGVTPEGLGIRDTAADCHDTYIALREAISRHDTAVRAYDAGKQRKAMRLTLVAAIRYLEQNTLGESDFIVLDLWGDEGYELQALARQYEGMTSLLPARDVRMDSDNPCKNTQVKCLMAGIAEADLAIQFIDSYPAHERDDDELNLRVVIMPRATLQNALRRFDPCEDARSGASIAPAPVLNGFKGHSTKPRKPHKPALATT
jgi:hypothetical protein